MKKPKKTENPDTVALVERMKDMGPASAYAMRIWEGQSSSLPVSVRIERIIIALRAQGLIADGDVSMLDLNLPLGVL